MRTRIFAGIAFTGLFASALVCVGGWYVVSNARGELEEKQQQAANLEAREANLAKLERELMETKEERARLQGLLIEPGFVIEFLGLVETLGAAYGTEVTTASLDVAEELELLDTLKIDINASGSLPGVLRVLELLETLPYVSEVSDMSIRATGEAGAEVWEGDFTLIIAKHKDI